MKVFVVSHCDSGENFSNCYPRVFKTLEGAKQELKLAYDNFKSDGFCVEVNKTELSVTASFVDDREEQLDIYEVEIEG